MPTMQKSIPINVLSFVDALDSGMAYVTLEGDKGRWSLVNTGWKKYPHIRNMVVAYVRIKSIKHPDFHP